MEVFPHRAQGLTRIRSDPAQIHRRVEETGWLRDFGEGQLAVLSRYLSIHRADKGSVIFREGDREAFLCVLLQGKVFIAKETSSRAQKILVALGPGKVFGELSLVDDEPRSASALAAEDCELLVLTEKAIERLADDFPRLALRFLKHLARLISQKLRQTSGALVEHLKQ